MAVVAAMVIIVLLQAVSGQNPSLAFRYDSLQVGTHCDGPNYLEQFSPSFRLGSPYGAVSGGIVAHYLRAVAMSLSRDNEFYTDSVPFVRIFRVRQTCASKFVYVTGGNQTFAALIEYSCRGVACRQRANETRTMTYQHLFSFVCMVYSPGGPGLVTQLPRLRYVLYVDRNPNNSIVTTVTAPSGSCELCRVLPPNLRNENYDPATGCNSKMPLVSQHVIYIHTSIIL